MDYISSVQNRYYFINYDEYIKEFSEVVPPGSGMDADAFILNVLEDEEIEVNTEINGKLEIEGLSLFFEFSISEDESSEFLLLRFIGVETFDC